LTAMELASNGNVTILGPGAGRLIIDGDGKSRVFNINDGNATTDSPTLISGLSITKGDAGAGIGGGIYSSESLTLKSVVLSGNTAHNGGAVCVYDKTGAEGAK